MDFEFIDENEIESVKRGRKSTVSPELVEAFRSAPTGKAIRLAMLAGDPTDAEAYKLHKASASATIRSAGTQAGKVVKISWSPAGVPQVSFSKPKPAKSK
jgi:hypothetical protein